MTEPALTPAPNLPAEAVSTHAEAFPFTRQLLSVAGHLETLRTANRRGPLAVLRRLGTDPDYIPPQVFWDIADRYEIARHEEDFWLAIMPLMVRHPHRFDLPSGRALAAAGVSAPRIERWLRLDRNSARREAGRLLSHLGDGGLDWTRFGPLLRFWTEDQRRSLAREFFLSTEYRQRKATGDAK